jgi:hypothetical protein
MGGSIPMPEEIITAAKDKLQAPVLTPAGG